MLRMMSILTVLLAMTAVGCSDKARENPAPVAGQVDRSAANRSATEPSHSAAAQETESTPEASTHESEGPAAPANGEPSPDPSSVPATKPVALQNASPTLDAGMQAQVGKWLEQMASEAAVERRAGGEALSEQGEAAMPYIVQGLRRGSDLQKRGAATYLIGRISPRDQEAVKALIEALASPDVELQRTALQAVERLPDETLQQALPALQTLVQDPALGEAYRSRAVRAIAKLGPGGAAAVSTLIALATVGDDANLRRASYFAITKVAPAEVAEDFFQGQLKSDAPADLRRLAAKWLGTVARSDPSLQCLIDAFGDADESVRLEAVDALVAIGKPAVGVLIQSLDATNVDVRRHSVLTLGKLGFFAADAIPALQARLADPDQQVRDLTAAALKNVPTH